MICFPPDYVSSVFSFVSSPLKRKGQQQIDNYDRRRNSNKIRLECCDSEVNADNASNKQVASSGC